MSKWSVSETLDKMTHELVLGGMSQNKAKKQSYDIYRICSLGEINYPGILMRISPTKTKESLERQNSVAQCLAVFIAAHSSTHFSLWVGLMQWLGFSPEQASKWIANREDVR